MTADEFIARERKEWGEAFKIFAKEVLGSSKKTGTRFLATVDKELIDLIADRRSRKRRK